MYKADPQIYQLGSDFYDEVRGAEFPKSILKFRNNLVAKEIGLENLSEQEWKKHFCDFHPLPGNIKTPLALRYHGHQFQHYNPELGDGRGFLFAQVRDQKNRLLDLGTKGSGQTPYSRRGDGRLTLKGAVREILATEYLQASGVNTSKTFSVFETGENLVRHDEPSPTRSAILFRLSHSHIRFGTFQRLAFLGQTHNIEKLLAYSVNNYYPHLKDQSLEKKTLSFLDLVCKNTAKTCAQWMMAGFVHGVLNTDNMNITGESFDYGPYRFLPHYDPLFTAAYFDPQSLYAYGRQPNVVFWNLQQLALCFEHVLEEDKRKMSLQNFAKYFSQELMSLFLKKLNLESINPVEDNKLFSYTFEFLESSKTPFADFFFDFFSFPERNFKALSGPRKDFYKGNAFNQFFNQIKSFKVKNETLLSHPYWQNENAESLYIHEIESIWRECSDLENWKALDDKIQRIRNLPSL